MTLLRRHTLVWLSQAPQPDMADDTSVVDQWHSEGNPFVVCRQRSEAGFVSLGFCLVSPAHRPRRIAVHARKDTILHTTRPPALNEVSAAFSNLSIAADRAGLDIRVYGSWMWQTLTGSPHVNASSDLDLLIEVTDQAVADRAVEFLERESGNCPCKIDGELSFPGAGEVHWREYLQGEPILLVKSIDATRMLPREDLWK